MNDTIIFDISHLKNAATGTSEKYTFDGPVQLEGLDLSTNVSGSMEIMRIEGGVNVCGKNIQFGMKTTCEKCLKDFVADLEIEELERIFYFDAPRTVTDIHDVYLIDRKKLNVDLTELLRQEIILHFPLISVCSKQCKGICQHCGKDLNEGPCACKNTDIDLENKPLKNLKNLI